MSNCALDSDGNLLDAAHIEWFNDPDDKVPISGPAQPLTAMSSLSSTTPTTIGMFFHNLGSPTMKVAGARRSRRATRPSTKITDPDNTASSSKRKAAPDVARASTSRRRRVVSPVTSDADHDTDTEPTSEFVDTEKEDGVANDNKDADDNEDAVADDNEDDGVDGEEHIEDGYLQTKAMADSDRKVSIS